MITIPVEIQNETELAWLVGYEEKTWWVPKSKCKIENGELTIPEWLAIDKGMV